MKAWVIFGKVLATLIVLVWGLAVAYKLEPALTAAIPPPWVVLGFFLTMASGITFPILIIFGVLGVEE